ncbi:Malectin [Corchorus capsularis]|uniref:Malectin n=1 Tax=Corchorus capsularis TaxID=210143 RepID=A0A1R3GER2_COCAP|nr:Malectin [Corchorus capsularis]
MEKLLFWNMLLPLLLLQFYPVLILSEPYQFPEKYFINCGSDSAVTQGSRKFVGDKNPGSFSVGKSNPVTDSSQSAADTSSLYQTARFYTEPFSYNLDINETGQHVIRLHFFPFKSDKANLEDALFNVSASRASQNFIPEIVYRTCKEVNLNSTQAANSADITWHFNVSKNARHLVRVHFCDILSQSPNIFNFSLLIYGKYNQSINPVDYTIQTAVPFYHDFVVDTGDSDFISIGVAPMDGFLEKRAYLNGLEIMEFITEPGLELGMSEQKKKHNLFIIIGSVVGGLVVCCLIVLFLLCKKRRKTKPLETMTSYVSAQPDASAPFLSLLSNFTMKNSNESIVVKEFLLTIKAGKFEIYFIPSKNSSPLAFINAIEVFLAPTGFIPDKTIHINSTGIKGNYSVSLSTVLQKVHGINVGGSTVTADNDTLMRNWITDDQFLLIPGSAETKQFGSYDNLIYGRPNGSTEYIAPREVYGTAKMLNTSTQTKSSNITWRFKVNEQAKYFVRAHFCDFISNSLEYPGISLCINGNFCQWISPYETVQRLAAPFYADFVVESAKSGNFDISVSPYNPGEIVNHLAFLNGLEIMQLMENSYSSFVPPRPKKKIFLIIAASLGLAFAFIIIVIVIVRLVCMKEDQSKIPDASAKSFSHVEVAAAK